MAQRNTLVKNRTPVRRKITTLCSLMISLVEKLSSHSTLRRKLLELEELQTECERLDKQLTDIYSEIEDEESWNKEMESQADYTGKIAETLIRTEGYLEERATEPCTPPNRKLSFAKDKTDWSNSEIPEQRIDQEIDTPDQPWSDSLEEHPSLFPILNSPKPSQGRETSFRGQTKQETPG